jgi:hypothetical protein|tara:strand:- start:175 stop:444 length:270 start_codon:yes stop_codon:yes gene_type:complete
MRATMSDARPMTRSSDTRARDASRRRHGGRTHRDVRERHGTRRGIRRARVAGASDEGDECARERAVEKRWMTRASRRDASRAIAREDAD